ncbi:uncharacterized protein LOC132992432 [Labrus mixtus]|uniref:uncharacterized protein LOC132992432 n=1 Tax=Labrus mixtus TaxID=508554 RepID=UPI0029BFCC7C|nr:uncharacterized protein LOC132992432 [Labrus mixtus]
MQSTDMGQKQTRSTVPTEEACRRVDIYQDKSVLILLQHCRDIKQRDTRFRLVSLLLLLSCVSLFIFLQLREYYGSTRQENVVQSGPAYSKQECPSADPQSISSNRLPIALTSVKDPKNNQSGYLNWRGENHRTPTDAIEIPKTGHYFVYLRITFQCQEQHKDQDYKEFNLILQSFNEGYGPKPEPRNLTTAMDSVGCRKSGPLTQVRTLTVVQLFHLIERDHVKVWVNKGLGMIISAFFGAFQT